MGGGIGGNRGDSRKTGFGKVAWFSDKRGYGFCTLDGAKRDLLILQEDIAEQPGKFRTVAAGQKVSFMIREVDGMAAGAENVMVLDEHSDSHAAGLDKGGPYRTNANMKEPERELGPDDLMRRWVLETDDDEWTVFRSGNALGWGKPTVEAIQHKDNFSVRIKKTLLSAKIIYEGGGTTLYISMPWRAGRMLRAKIKRVIARNEAEKKEQRAECERQAAVRYAAMQARLRQDMANDIRRMRESRAKP